MHETAICANLVDAVLGELEKLADPKAVLRSVKIVAGGMHQLVPDNMNMAYETLTRGTRAEGSVLKIDWRPTLVQCSDCGAKSRVDSPFFICGDCESGNVKVVEGKELYLSSMEIGDEGDER